MAEIEKLKHYKAELNKLKKVFKNLPQDRYKIQCELIENAAFLSASLKELREKIEENGYTDVWQNGPNQGGARKSPEVEVYSTMLKQYTIIIKQLCDQLPEGEGKNKDDLMAFITSK